MNNKIRLLVTISFSFSIRYIIRTGLLERIKMFAEPVIVLTWKQDDLMQELTANGYEVHTLPTVKQSDAYSNIRRKINFWFAHFRLNGYGKKQEQFLSQYVPMKTRILRQAIKQYNIFKLYLPGAKARLLQQEKALLKTDTNCGELIAWIQSLHANAVFTVTPFHNKEDIFLRACQLAGLKMTTSILSFDNITKRGWIPLTYDVYMVWNQYNVDELKQIYPATQKKNVHIVGAPQFDFYNKEEWLLPISEWKKSVGINEDDTRKIILYAGGPKELFPEEPIYLKHINNAINNNEIEDQPLVLFRCHPVDAIQRWKDAVGATHNIIYDTSWTGKEKLQLANVTDYDIKKLCSTLHYTDVHINLCSTMTLDGSMFNKPQIGPAYLTNKRASRLLKQMYFQKHFIPIIQNKGIALANSREALIGKINEALQAPSKYTGNSRQVLTNLITYNDNNATNRVALVLADFLMKSNNYLHQFSSAALNA